METEDPEAEPPVYRFLFQKLQVFWGDKGHVFAKAGDDATYGRDAGSSS